MDPFTAALILGVVMSGTQLYMGVQAQKQQSEELYRQQAEQEAAREAQVRKEMGIASQRTNTALAGAGSRNRSAITPSSAIAQAGVGDNTSVLGGLPSVQKAAKTPTSGTAGTF